jgi:sterol desaturase/sphingolipid hydroxylase (fatty acid hydroxylase superfamily)
MSSAVAASFASHPSSPFAFIERAELPIDLAAQARIARRRLLPVTILYSAYALVLLALGLTGPHPFAALAWFAAGVAVWTFVEYLVHRYILHGVFADGPGFFQHLGHKLFGHLHVVHHRRPWDGAHINGTLKDTGVYVSILVALSFLGPLHTWPMLMAGFVQSYIVEEWVHQSVHFYPFKGWYWEYIRRHHRYHHSPKGAEMAYGLSNGVWDVICATRIPEPVRSQLYKGMHQRKRRS